MPQSAAAAHVLPALQRHSDPPLSRAQRHNWCHHWLLAIYRASAPQCPRRSRMSCNPPHSCLPLMSLQKHHRPSECYPEQTTGSSQSIRAAFVLTFSHFCQTLSMCATFPSDNMSALSSLITALEPTIWQALLDSFWNLDSRALAIRNAESESMSQCPVQLRLIAAAGVGLRSTWPTARPGWQP